MTAQVTDLAAAWVVWMVFSLFTIGVIASAVGGIKWHLGKMVEELREIRRQNEADR